MSAQKTQASTELHPLSIVRMLWKKKLIIGLVWIAGSVLAVAVVWRLPPVYKSEAVILVDSQKIPERFVSSTVSSDIQDRIATISQEIMSSTDLKKIIEDFSLYKAERAKLTEEEILDAMRKDITIAMEKGWAANRPGAFRVAYQGPDPQVVAQVTNRLANLYIEENLRVREVQAEGTSEFMDTQLTEAKKKLDQLEIAVSEYKVKHNGELPQQESAISSELTRQDLALQSNRDAIRRAEESASILHSTLGIAEGAVASLSQLRQPPAAGPLSAGQIATTQADARVNIVQPMSEAHNKILRLRAKLESLRELGYTDRHPDIVATKEGLAAALLEEAKEIPATDKKPPASANLGKSDAGEQTTPAVRNAPVNRPDDAVAQAQERVVVIKKQIESLQHDVEERTSEQKKIQGNVDLLQKRLAGLPVREQEMAGLTRDYEISKANYRTLLDKKLSAEMSTDMERRQKSERFALLDPPRVPEKPFKPNRPLFAGMGSVAALSLGLLWGLGLEIRKSCVLGEWELPKGVVVLGRIPYIEAGSIGSSRPRSSGRRLRRWAFGVTSVFLVAMLATGFYLVRSRF